MKYSSLFVSNAKLCFLFLLVLFFSSCKSDAPETSNENTPITSHELTDFFIKLPDGWKHEKRQGTDSQIGIFTNQIDTLTYDFGWYTHGFDFVFGNNPEYSIQKVTIDKKPGQFLFPKNNLKGTTGIFLQVDQYNTLTISAKVKNSKNHYWSIFETITFTKK